MSGNKRNQKQSGKYAKTWYFVLLNIATVIAVIALIFNVANLIFEVREDNSYGKPSENSYAYYYTDENYSEMAMYYINGEDSYKSGNTKQYCAVGAYYAEGIMYKSCVETNDNVGAQTHKKKMEEAQAAMGELSSAKSNIDKLLGING